MSSQNFLVFDRPAWLQSCKTFKPNFTPRKAHKLQQFRHLDWTKKCWASLYTNLSQFVQIICKKVLILQLCACNQTFTPTSQYFYMDISVISVTLCNSEWRRQKTKVVQSAGLKRRSGAGAIQVTLWGANGCRAFCVTKIVLAQLSSLLVQPSRCNHCDRRERTNLKKTDFRIFCATKTTLTQLNELSAHTELRQPKGCYQNETQDGKKRGTQGWGSLPNPNSMFFLFLYRWDPKNC